MLFYCGSLWGDVVKYECQQMHVVGRMDTVIITIAFLNLTRTLLQSLMTVTQRRGVLVKEECID